jgi:chromate transporter
MLRGEREPLSEQERTAILGHRISYLANDLVVPTWNAAFVYDTPGGTQAAVDILESANTQLLGFRYYDRSLARELAANYSRLQRPRWHELWRGSRYTRAARQVRSLFIDVNELTDRTENADPPGTSDRLRTSMVGVADIARVFLLLGSTAFGGPAAHIAMMHEQIVRRRRWLTDAEFTDLIAAVNLIPGPNSTELAIHIGRRQAGVAGLAVAGICFIVPAAAMVSALAVIYVEYGRTPDARAMMAGVSPVIIAIIVHATVQLGKTALKSPWLWLVGAAAVALSGLRVNELLILLGAGLLTAGASGARHAVGAMVVACGSGVSAAAASTTAAVSLVQLTLFFLKVGSVLFGSGYVLLAFLRADLVERWGWLTEQQLIDAIAVGQFTPGPVFTTATFVGYVLGGWPGAALSTVAIFLPAFIFVWITHPLIPRFRASKPVGAFLDGVVAASLGLMAAVAAVMARAALGSPMWIAVCAASLLALAVWRINSAWLVLAGAVLGIALR